MHRGSVQMKVICYIATLDPNIIQSNDHWYHGSVNQLNCNLLAISSIYLDNWQSL